MVVSNRCTLVVVSLSCAILKKEGSTTAKLQLVPVAMFLPRCTAKTKALAEQKKRYNEGREARASSLAAGGEERGRGY